MTQRSQDKSQLQVLCFFAHPDDEAFGSGGTLAEFVRKGHKVATVCATNGDVGEISDPSLATPDNLWQVRQEELRQAMKVTGVPDVRFLGYRDSGMDGTDDNKNPACLYQAEPSVVEAQISSIVSELKPDVVFTHDPTGGYGHPDHITVYQRTTAVIDSMGENRPHFYHVCYPRSNFKRLWEEMTAAGITPPFAKEALDVVGSPDDYVTTVRDVSAYVDIKQESLNQHRTQIDPNGPFSSLDHSFMNNWMSTEYFYLTTPQGAPAPSDILKEVL